MATVTMKLTGVEGLQRALATMPDVVEAQVLSVVQATTYGISARAQALVPVDTGLLKRSIGSNAGTRQRTGRIGITDPKAYYWRFVEFGTKYVGARPFFRPAFDQETALVDQRLRDAARRIEQGASTVGGRFL